MNLNGKKKGIYLEDYIEANNFCFELGLSIIQPFIDSIDENQEYSVIRAIVCCGEFVDAYKRVSKNPRVNLSQDAKAEKCKDDVADFCVKVIKVFEEQAFKYQPDTFRKEIYNSYIDERGKTRTGQRQIDAFGSFAGATESIFSKLKLF